MIPTRSLLPLFSLLLTAATVGAKEWNLTEHLPRERVIIQSHRGAGFLADENTLPSFELGWELGTVPEGDVRTTADGVLVLFHDTNFKRILPHADPAFQARGIETFRYEELAGLDVGAWKGPQFAGRHLPRLADIFAAMRGRPERRLYLDIKRADLTQLAAEVRAHDVAAQVILASRHPRLLREWKTLLPDSETLLWMRGTESSLQEQIAELRAARFAGITQLQVHIHPAEKPTAGEPFAVSRRFLRELGAELRQQGILFQALPFMADESVYAQLMDLGVASFATDYPDVTVREIDAYYSARRAAAARTSLP